VVRAHRPSRAASTGGTRACGSVDGGASIMRLWRAAVEDQPPTDQRQTAPGRRCRSMAQHGDGPRRGDNGGRLALRLGGDEPVHLARPQSAGRPSLHPRAVHGNQIGQLAPHPAPQLPACRFRPLCRPESQDFTSPSARGRKDPGATASGGPARPSRYPRAVSPLMDRLWRARPTAPTPSAPGNPWSCDDDAPPIAGRRPAR